MNIEFTPARDMPFTEFRDALNAAFPFERMSITQTNVFGNWSQFIMDADMITTDAQASIIQKMNETDAAFREKQSRSDPDDRTDVFGWGRRTDI